MAYEGMDVDVVRSIATSLHQQSEQITAIVTRVDQLVAELSTTWMGHDAHDFHGWWTGQHRPVLTSAGEAVAGLGRSAAQNADDQAKASGRGATTTSGERGGTAWLGAVAAAGVGATLARGISAARKADDLWEHGVTTSRDQQWGAHGERTGQRSGSWGAIPVSGGYSLSADASAKAHESLTLTRNGVAAGVTASAAVGVAAAAHGTVGNRYVGAEGSARVAAGAEASGAASVTVGPHGATGHAGVEGYAGAQATANASVHAAGVGATGGVTGYAGIGGHADVDGQITAHEVKATVSVGGAIGIGGGVTFTVDVKPEEMLDSVRHFHLGW